MADLDGLFGESASSSSGSSGGSLDTLFGKAPVPVRAPAPAAAPAITAQASKIASTVPAPVKPQGFLGKAGSFISDEFGKATRAVGDTVLGPDENDPAAMEAIGKKSSLGRTLAFLPSSIAANLPFGIGDVFSSIQQDPKSAASITFKDALGAVPTAIKDTALGLARGIASVPVSLAGAAKTLASGGRVDGNISVTIPGLGKIDNAQLQVTNMINSGMNPVEAALKVGSDSIFNTLFFADLAAKPFQPSVSKVAEFQGDVPRATVDPNAIDTGPQVVKNAPAAPVTPGAKSFRLYETPSVTKPLPAEAITRMQEQGISFGKGYDPDAPTFFRVSQKANGKILGEVMQVKPSVFSRILDSMKARGESADPANVPPEAIRDLPSSDVTTFHSQEIDPTEAEKAVKSPHVELTALSPADAHNADEATSRLQAGADPKAVTKELAKSVGPEKAAAIVEHAQSHGTPAIVAPGVNEETVQTAIKAAKVKVANPEAIQTSKPAPGSLDELLGAAKAPVIKNAPTSPKEYPTIHEGGVIKMVKGDPVDIVSGIDTFLHQGDGGWVVSEASTGRFLADSLTKEGAVAKARSSIEKVGTDKFTELLEKHKLPQEDAAKHQTQKQKVKETVEKKGEASVAEIAEETKILEPNVRRILGMGAKDGTFDRVGKGVYKVKVGDQEVAYVIPGDAIETLPKLADEGFKADMVFLDIPYDTPAVKGGNRGVDYNLISVEQFGVVLDASKKILRTPDSALIHMFSQAPSGMKAMQKYNDLLIEKGFKPIARAAYTKFAKDGETRLRNMRGAVMPPEGILILNQSGKQIENPPDLDFKMVRPKGYQTEKPAEMLKALIEMTTAPGDMVLDPFAGSGVTSEEAVKAGRKTVAIEKNEEQAGKIADRIQKAADELENNDKVRITERESGKSQERFIHRGKNGELAAKDNASRIPYKIDLSKFDVELLEKNSPDAPQQKPMGINSPEMIESERKQEDIDRIKAEIEVLKNDRGGFRSGLKLAELDKELSQSVADKYWDEEIAPSIADGKPIIIGADNIKDFFDQDYDDANHKTYSQAAFLLYERALKESRDDVVFTGGGPGSGKTEILVDQIADSGFKGIVYDSNMSNYDGVVKQIEMARADDRDVEIYGITPDLQSARTFTIQRANRTGRRISDNTFARGHAGFPDVAAKLIENGIIDESDVHILDTHDVSNDLGGAISKFTDKAFVDRPLEYLRGLGYTEANVRQEHSAALYDSQGARSTEGSQVREESGGPSRVSGPDREAKEVSRRTPPRGFIAPGVVVEGIANKAAEVETFLEKTQQAIELSDDLALNLYKLQGANQSDLEEVSKIAKKINKVSAADNEAVYFHAEDALNPHQKPTELNERQQELYEKYDKPFADANEQLMAKIKKAGYNIPGEGYIHRVPKAYKSPLDAVLNPKERDEVKLNLGGLLKKTSTSMKRRTLMALEDEKGNRRVVSIKNSEFTIPKGKREGDVIRSKRVTGFNAEKKPEEDLGRFSMKSHKQLLDSETKPIEKKLKSIQDTVDGLNMLRIKEPLGKGRVEKLEKEVADLADTFDRQFAEGAFTGKELRPLLKKFRAREAELRVLKTVSPSARLTNQASRIAALTDDMRELSNELARIEGSYDPETLDQRVFVDKNDKEWRIVQATTREIEAQTNTEYYHNALASRIVQYLELNRIARALDFIESFKSDPRFSEFAVEDTGQNPPTGETGTWKRTLMPQFRKYWLEPRTADVFDNFFNYTRPNEGVLETALDATGHFLVNTIFYNPIAHPLNVTALWLADRGGTFITPTRYGVALRAFAKAFTAISKKNDDYTYALLHGAPIMNTSTNRADLAKQLYDVLSSEMDRDVERSKPLAERLGFKTVLDMKKAFGKAWHGATWIPNDILTLQAIYERMDTRDLTFEEAVQETARFIPDYRMPARILGSRKVSETLQSRGLLGSVWFAAAYHFGELRSVGSIAKDIALPEGGFTKEGSAERYDALGKALMLALLAAIVYPAIDKLWQKVTGSPNTYMSRSGSVKLVADAMQVATGEADYTKILQAEMALNPAYLGAAELMFNTDFYTRNPIFGYPPAIGGLTFLESMIAPVDAASYMSPEDFALSLFNVHTPKNSPGKAAAQAQMYDEEPILLSKVKQEIAAGADDVATAQMAEFNQRLATNYQQALIQEDKPPATPAEVKEFVGQNGIKVPGTVAQANADKLYADNQKAGKQSLIDTVATYAKAIGTDPVTAFSRIFSGQRIVRVDNASFFGPDSAVIVARDDVMEAAVRAEQGQAEGFTDEQMKGLQLDHVIALELGGSNTPTNLNLVTVNQNESLHPIVENFLAKALTQGTVSRSNVKQYILDYKAGTLGETLPTDLENEWKANGSKSLTAQEIFDLVNSGKAK